MRAYLEDAIRWVSCDGCGAPSGHACRDYPSGKQVEEAHSARYFKALDAGMLPMMGFPVPLLDSC